MYRPFSGKVSFCIPKHIHCQSFHKKCNILEAKENSCYITFSAKTGHLTACVTISKAERCYTNMEINVAKLNELPEGSYQLIDMRSDRDFEYGTIPGAIHISQEDLQGNPQIIKSKKVILFCAHGTNSHTMVQCSLDTADNICSGLVPLRRTALLPATRLPIQ